MSWLGLLVLLTAPAHAADEDRAKELFRNGRDLYDNGRYEDAIAAWQAAYDLSEKPLLLYNLSNAYERTAQFEQALSALTRYRAFAKASEAETIDARIASLESRAAEERRARDEAAALRREQQAELEAQRRSAELARQQAAAAVQPARSSAPIVPILVTGAGAGLLGVGVISGVGVSGARKTLKDPALCSPDGLCKSQAQDSLSKQRSGALITDLTLVTGLAATGLGTLLFVKHTKKNKNKPTPTALWAAPGSNGATMGVSGAF